MLKTKEQLAEETDYLKTVPLTRVLFVDFDGTIRHGKDELGFFATKAEHVKLFDGVLDILRAYDAARWVIVGCTNQGGVALGYLSEDDVTAMNEATDVACEGLLTITEASLQHPDGAGPYASCWFRKPSPGMIYNAIARLMGSYYLAPPSQCLFVGDRPEDAEAARRADTPFMNAAFWRAGGGLAYLNNTPLTDVPIPQNLKTPLFNSLPVQKRTWPYGTRLKANVVSINNGEVSAGGVVLPLSVALIDENHEGHLIMGQTETVTQGQAVVLEFTEGGPLGGYWRILP